MPRIPAADRRVALIDAGLRLIARYGPAGVSTRAVVAEAGMSLASFHYAFDSRDAYLDALIAAVVEREQQAVLPVGAPGLGLRPTIEAGMLRYLDHLAADPEHEQAMLELTLTALRSPERHPLAVAQYRRYAALAERALETAGEQAGAAWRVPVTEAARVLVAFTDGLTLTWLVDRDDAAARAVVRAAADAIARMADDPMDDSRDPRDLPDPRGTRAGEGTRTARADDGARTAARAVAR
ncbi:MULTISPECIES: TetR/AcrR family transcriptional regulator [unclassified Agromyces]|uniref:TetR/AcrR family transcriptional regulator n=1 Tax=unclassified Agromyces TaxID=2639701 RepID=UPI00301549BE